MDTLSVLPASFFLSVVALLGFGVYAWIHRREAWGIPMAVVLATAAVWYHGDALYNDYEEYRILMGDQALNAGWWQVLLFIVAFGLFVQPLHKALNWRYANLPSHLMLYMETRRLEHPMIQRQIDHVAGGLLLVWMGLMSVALFRVEFDFIGLFAPYLGQKATPWGRSRIGGGIDAILSLAGYVQILLTASFGVIAAVARNPVTRSTAILICFLSFPFYIFDRTRNTMLATILPGMLAWIIFRLRGGLLVKGAALLAGFLLVNYWFTFVIANRNTGVTQAFRSGEGVEEIEDVKHAGLSMFSELGYMNDYFSLGTYEPKMGERYFAELVNPIPRALWKNKPLVGIDYAIARGFGSDQASEANASVHASIATGMIGQGVVNFGRFFGPIAAAFLMSIWVSILARQDLLGKDPARLLLFSVGMILTFNMGRDITLLVLYPFIFGWLLLLLRNYFKSPSGREIAGGKPSGKRNKKRRVGRSPGRTAFNGRARPPETS